MKTPEQILDEVEPDGWTLSLPQFPQKQLHTCYSLADVNTMENCGWKILGETFSRDKVLAMLEEARKAADCAWMEDESGEYYDTSCGHAFVLIEGTPAENDMRFCPYCGGKLWESCGKRNDGVRCRMR